MTDENIGATGGAPKRPESWERDVLERLAFAVLTEQRRARRWGIFFKLFFAAWLLFVVIMLTSDDWGTRQLATRHSALVDLEGAIMPDTQASADNVISGLRSAFENKHVAGVILRANSPGGSPVQAAYIYDEIKRLRGKYPKTPIYGVVGDMCASGCYYAVAATDKVYTDKASIIGSIGVVMNGFGFTETMKKFGVERRLMTAGEHKGFLDPFGPVRPEERAHAQELLNQIHRQFIAKVREGRGNALKETRDMFSGLFWTGEQAIKLGLADGLGSAGSVARDVIEAEEIVDYSFRENVFDRFARRFGTGMAEVLGAEMFGRGAVLK
jgi:protease IV